MKSFENVKPGDIIKLSKAQTKEETSNEKTFHDERWKVLKVYRNVVLAQSVRVPQIRRSFSRGDLVMMGIENGMRNI